MLLTSPFNPIWELSYQWIRDTTAIDGAVFQTYSLTEADVEAMIMVQVTAANCQGTVTSLGVGPVRSITGINEEASALFMVYPNPANGAITVEGTKDITIFNTLGQAVATSHSEDGTHTFTLPLGIYFVKAEGGMVKKVVVE